MVDRTALKFNQVSIIVFLGIAWLIASKLIVAIVAAIMLIGTAWPKAALFKQIYVRIVRPTGLLRARPISDRAAPHRFAQGFGGVVLVAAYFLLVAGLSTAGWTLTLVVLALALVNAVFNFCAGCFVYYQLERLGLIGSPKGA